MRVLVLAAALGTLATSACEARGNDPGPSSEVTAGEGASVPERRPTHVDSLFPMDEELRRFRAGIPEVTGFTGGAVSKKALVEELIQALETADTTAVVELSMSRAEFAWLYFPHTFYIRPPYELPPGLVWFQQQNRSSTGLARLLRRYAGRPIHYDGFACPVPDGEALGRGTIWHGCTVLGTPPSGERVEERLFGSILEWDGRYKLVSFSNEF